MIEDPRTNTALLTTSPDLRFGGPAVTLAGSVGDAQAVCAAVTTRLADGGWGAE